MCLSPKSTKTCFKDVLSCLWFLEGHRELGFYVPSWFVYSHSEIKPWYRWRLWPLYFVIRGLQTANTVISLNGLRMDSRALCHHSPLFAVKFCILTWIERWPWDFLLSACKSLLQYCMLPGASWEEIWAVVASLSPRKAWEVVELLFHPQCRPVSLWSCVNDFAKNVLDA